MRLLVLFGSQTGTAQDVAEQIWRESKKYGFSGPVMSMDDFNIQKLINEYLVVFVVSTTGQGDEPDNMKKSWKFLLRKSLPLKSLQGLQFACLGLGDSSYQKYNFAAKKLNNRLIQLSAVPLIPLGLCDDQHDYGFAAAFLPWVQSLWSVLKQKYTITFRDSRDFYFKWHVTETNEPSSALLDDLQWAQTEAPVRLKVEENIRKTPSDHFQDVRMIKLQFPNGLYWKPGDILDIKPCNSDEKVDELFNIFDDHNLKLYRNTVVELKQLHDDMLPPLVYRHPVTLGLLAKYVWDLNAVPRHSVFSFLASNCKDDLEKEKLVEFSSAEGLEDAIAYANRPRRSILEVLYDFRHATAGLTLPILFEIFQTIQCRSFSIASIPETNTLDIIAALVEYKTKLSTPRRGLCSTWLKTLLPGDIIFGFIRKGVMAIPENHSMPLIMVGPGTGIAPLRSILLWKETRYGNLPENVVFFGCRSRTKDFFVRDDFERLEANNIAKFFIAFSRDQDHKIYVQHLIRDKADYLKDLIVNKCAVILLCGSSKNMPQEVEEAFCEVVGDRKYIEMMAKTKRYQTETWS